MSPMALNEVEPAMNEVILDESSSFHVMTVGWDHTVIQKLFDPVATKSCIRFSHLVHPKHVPERWPGHRLGSDIHFFRDNLKQEMPPGDPELLASLELPGLPTIHNMILGDRVVSKLDYPVAIRYATFLARRLMATLRGIRPSTVIASFDSVHSGLALATARKLGIPVYVLNFSVIPQGLACFVDRMTPAARVHLRDLPNMDLWALAERSLQRFEDRDISAFAHVPGAPLTIRARALRLPSRFRATIRTLRRARNREHLRYTEARATYSLPSTFALFYRTAMARRALARVSALVEPTPTRFVLFGLHLQPESSIDVWAPFFSNQMRVIELLSRSIPPTHKLLVKIHKSDIANYSRAELERMSSFPGVKLVAPLADTRKFLERAELVIAIQGTMGLEAALLGKPVIMLGESPVTIFPSATGAGPLNDLPALVRRKLEEGPAQRKDIIRAYVDFLAPFMPASLNDWTAEIGEHQIDDYAAMFKRLRNHLASEQLSDEAESRSGQR